VRSATARRASSSAYPWVFAGIASRLRFVRDRTSDGKKPLHVTAALFIIGVVLVLLAIVDAVQTTLTAGSGGGPLTTPVGRVTWRLLLRVSSGHSSKRLGYGGMLTLLLTVSMWVLLLWSGWTLIFAASPGTVVDATTGAPASVPATIYYAGFVVFTLGVGDFVSTSGTWQVLTALASFIGLFVITLSITYLVSVVSAAVTRRQLAESISILGRTGPEIVLAHWNDGQLSSQFPSRLQTLSTQLLKTTQQHLAYPVLHYLPQHRPRPPAPRVLSQRSTTRSSCLPVPWTARSRQAKTSSALARARCSGTPRRCTPPAVSRWVSRDCPTSSRCATQACPCGSSASTRSPLTHTVHDGRT
jgi:hypothetical protein